MSWSLYCDIIDKIAPSAEIIKLHWIGEPLLNPKICEMIRYAKEKSDAQLFMSTNASLLKGDLAKEVRTAGLDKIILSIDGASKTSYERIRVNGKFDEIISNIDHFIKSTDSEGGPLCEVKMIQVPDNEHEVNLFRNKWSAFDCVSVNIMWLCTWAGQLPHLKKLNKYLCPYEPEARVPCSDLWFKMQIAWDGSVYLCCFDWSGSVSLGNLEKNSLDEIWNSKLISELRAQHLENNYSGICKKCNEWARFEEYEFWYDEEVLKEDPSIIWKSSS